jgi:hypothetical protein
MIGFATLPMMGAKWESLTKLFEAVKASGCADFQRSEISKSVYCAVVVWEF